MKILTNTNKPAHACDSTKGRPTAPKAVEKSPKVKKPNTHTSLGREIYFSVGKSQLRCCEQ